MGRWQYVQDDKTSTVDLKKMMTKLLNASLKSDLQIDVTFRARNKKDTFGHAVDVTFFKDGTNFTITFYQFRDLEKNNEIMSKALELMKDSSKFNEVEKWVRDV